MSSEARYEESCPSTPSTDTTFDFSQIGDPTLTSEVNTSTQKAETTNTEATEVGATFTSVNGKSDISNDNNSANNLSRSIGHFSPSANNTVESHISPISRPMTTTTITAAAEPAIATKQQSLPTFSNQLPEPMNNYNIPSDPAIIQTKLHLLQEKYPTFANKSLNDLEDLLKYPELFHTYFEGLEQVQSMRLVHSELITQRQQLSLENLQYQADLEKLRTKVEEQETLAESLNTAFSQMVHQQAEALRPYLPFNMLDRLKSNARDAEIESDELISNFLNSESSGHSGHADVVSSSELDSFINGFLKKRKSYHHSMALAVAVENAEKAGALEGAPLNIGGGSSSGNNN